MSAIPPKHTPDTPPYDAPETGGGLVAMYNAASHASAESFPVLKAFQDYLEAERSQARKRVMQLSIFFAVLMGVVVTGFLTAGIFMMRNMSTVQNKLLEVALASKAAPPQPAPAPSPVVQTSPALEESMRLMSRTTAELQSSLDKKLDGVGEITAKVHEKVASQDGELEKLRNEFRRMQEQSDKLKDELVTLKATAKRTEALVAVPVAQPAPVKAPAPAEPAAPPAAVAVAPAAPTITAAPNVAVAPAALAAVTPPQTPPAAPATAPKPEPQKKPAPAAAPAPAAQRDPRFPAAVKDPPVSPAGVTPPDAPRGMMATALPLKTKNTGTIPWRVLIPE